MNLGNTVQTWTGVCALAVLVLVGTAIFELAVPHTNPRKEWAKLDGEQKRLVIKQRSIEADLAKVRSTLESSTWKEGVEAVAPKVLTALTETAKTAGVKLTNFRPARPIAAGNLTMPVYTVNAAGSFNQIVDFMRKTEEPSRLLAVNSVQINNTDGASDQVTATVAFVTLVRNKPAEKLAANKGTKSG